MVVAEQLIAHLQHLGGGGGEGGVRAEVTSWVLVDLAQALLASWTAMGARRAVGEGGWCA